MTDHEPPYEPVGAIEVGDDWQIVVPDEFVESATWHTTAATVVAYTNSRTEYDSPHPELNPEDQEGVFIAFQHHGEDDWVYYELVPQGAEPKSYEA